MRNYPTNIRNKKGLFVYFVTIYLKFTNKKIFRETFLNPLIGVEIKKII